MRAKFVRDFLFEFERGLDPKAAMGVGAKTLWDKFREPKNWPTVQEIKDAGFDPETLYRIDRPYYRREIATPKDAPVFLELFPGMKPEFIKELDKDTVKRMEELKSEQGRKSSDLGFPQKDYKGGTDLIEEKLPETWAWIMEHAPMFIEVIKDGHYWSGGATAREFYKRYFDPFKYTAEEIFQGLSHPEIEGFEQIFKRFPKYKDKVRKTADTLELIKLGQIAPQFLKDLIKRNHIPDRTSNNWDSEADLLLTFIEAYPDQVRDLSAQLLGNIYKTGKKVPKSFSKKVLNKAGRYLPAKDLPKYFPELYPSDSPTEKLAARSKAENMKDYKAAEDIIKKHPDIELTTSNTQHKNGSMQFSITNVPYQSWDYLNQKMEDHDDGAIEYSIAKTGYLRKGRPGGNRLAVLHFDPYTTYTDLVKKALPKIDKDLKKLAEA